MMIIFIVLLVLIVVAYIMLYNQLVRLRNYIQEAWAQIDVQLKRRNDLIPNLIETVKGYAKYEQGTLSEVTRLRTEVMQAEASGDKAQVMEASNALSGTLKTLFAISEAYPDLKASTEYENLMEELTNTENKIAYSRQLYNTNVRNLNTKIQSFPTNLIAKIHHFHEETYLAIPETEKEVPKVQF